MDKSKCVMLLISFKSNKVSICFDVCPEMFPRRILIIFIALTLPFISVDLFIGQCLKIILDAVIKPTMITENALFVICTEKTKHLILKWDYIYRKGVNKRWQTECTVTLIKYSR